MEPAAWKKTYNSSFISLIYGNTPVIANDNNAYNLGYDLGVGGVPKTLSDLCGKLNKYIGDGASLLQGNADGSFSDTSTCKKCSVKTTETRHGGAQPKRYTP
jgi:hypothetical protein